MINALFGMQGNATQQLQLSGSLHHRARYLYKLDHHGGQRQW